jgi:uncharacterized protein (TIGR02300 family)
LLVTSRVVQTGRLCGLCAHGYASIALNQEVRMTSIAVTQSNKAARGTKRVCQACGVRFYDLLRDQIVCPSCGAHYTPAVQPALELEARKPPAGKTGWRQSAKRPGLVEPMRDAEIHTPAEAADAEDLEVATEEAANAAPDDDTVLAEQDGDDSDVADLVELDVENPKEG